MMEKMVELIMGYKQWEAELIMSDAAWFNRDFPQLTPDLWDRLMELQRMRNELDHQLSEYSTT